MSIVVTGGACVIDFNYICSVRWKCIPITKLFAQGTRLGIASEKHLIGP